MVNISIRISKILNWLYFCSRKKRKSKLYDGNPSSAVVWRNISAEGFTTNTTAAASLAHTTRTSRVLPKISQLRLGGPPTQWCCNHWKLGELNADDFTRVQFVVFKIMCMRIWEREFSSLKDFYAHQLCRMLYMFSFESMLFVMKESSWRDQIDLVESMKIFSSMNLIGFQFDE